MSTGLNKSWALRFNRSLSTLTRVYTLHRALSTNLQSKRLLSSRNNNQNNSNNLPLHRVILRPLPRVSHHPNSPFIKPMDNLPQGKMEARRHDNTPPLFQQQASGGRFLSPNDELTSA